MFDNSPKRESWLEKRRTLLTGTDIAKIFGVSEYGDAYSVWLDKRGLLPEQNKPWFIGGRLFERPILEYYAFRNNVELLFADSYDVVENSKYPNIGVSLDALWVDGNIPVDAKNKSYKTPGQWQKLEAGVSDIIPEDYSYQLLCQMAICDAEYSDLAVCFFGRDFEDYRQYRDAELEYKILSLAQDWWQVHIVDGVEPLAGHSEQTSEYIRTRRKKTEEGLIIKESAELRNLYERLLQVKNELKSLEKKEKEITNVVIQTMDNAEEVEHLFKISVRNGKKSLRLK